MIEQHTFPLYTAPSGTVKVDVCLKDETVWLSQKGLKSIVDFGELVENAAISILEITASDHKAYQGAEYLSDFDKAIERLEGKKKP